MEHVARLDSSVLAMGVMIILIQPFRMCFSIVMVRRGEERRGEGQGRGRRRRRMEKEGGCVCDVVWYHTYRGRAGYVSINATSWRRMEREREGRNLRMISHQRAEQRGVIGISIGNSVTCDM